MKCPQNVPNALPDLLAVISGRRRGMKGLRISRGERKGMKGKDKGGSERGRVGRERERRAGLGYLSRGPEFLVTPLHDSRLMWLQQEQQQQHQRTDRQTDRRWALARMAVGRVVRE